MENKGRAETFLRGELRIAACPRRSSNAVATRRSDQATQELGRGAIEAAIWFGVYAPGRTSPEVITRLNGTIVAAIQTQEIKSRMLTLGMKPTGTSSVELAKIQQADFERWGPIIKASGFKPDQ